MEEKRSSSLQPPPFLGTASGDSGRLSTQYSYHWRAEGAGSLYDRLFTEGYRAGVCIFTNNGAILPMQAFCISFSFNSQHLFLCLICAAGYFISSDEEHVEATKKPRLQLEGSLHPGSSRSRRLGLPLLLYSSCYEQEDMRQYAIHLLVLSHAFMIPSLKRICIHKLEEGPLTAENIVDVFHLALLCVAPRLHLLGHRLIVGNFKAVSVADKLRAMKKNNQRLAKELLKAVVDADLRRTE